MEQHDGQFVLIYEVNGFQFVKLSASQISQYLNYEIEKTSLVLVDKRGFFRAKEQYNGAK